MTLMTESYRENKPFCTYQIPKEPTPRDPRNYMFCLQEMYRDSDGDWCCSLHGKANKNTLASYKKHV